MKVLFLAGDSEHAHDYGLAYLFDGLCEVLGFDNVIDYPENPTFHLASPEDRDECALDSDLFYPRRSIAFEEAALGVDLIIVGVANVTAWRACHHPLLANTPVIAVDMSDQVRDQRAQFEEAIGKKVAAYCKREIPIGENWGFALPLSYPASRVPDPMPSKKQVVHYHATAHGFDGPGIPRMEIIAALRSLVPETMLDVGLYRGQAKGTRPSPEEYNAAKAQSLVGISWNGWPHVTQYDNNRLWSNFAFGLAQVIEKPRIILPMFPLDGTHCLYAKTPREAARLAADLVLDPERAKTIGEAGRQHFLKHHSSAARATRLLRIAEKVL